MYINKIRELFSKSSDGIISAKQVSNEGIHRGYLSSMVKSGELVKVGVGLYMNSNSWEDEIYLLQKRFNRGIFSHETALYLHGYTDRTPMRYTLTFPYGYKNELLEKELLCVKMVIKEKYDIGITEIATPCNNKVKVYDIERTLCDIVKGKGSDVQIIVEAMKKYARSKSKDIYKLMRYAEIMQVV